MYGYAQLGPSGSQTDPSAQYANPTGTIFYPEPHQLQNIGTVPMGQAQPEYLELTAQNVKRR